MNGTWQWQELAWDSPAAPAVGAAALERLATAVEVGPVVLELRAWAGGACWLVGCWPGRAVELEQLLGHHLPARLHRPQRQRLAVGQAVRLQVRGSHVSTSADRVVAATRALYACLSGLHEDQQAVVQLLIGEPPLPLLGDLHPRLLPPPASLVRSERVIGLTSTPGCRQPVAIPIRDAVFHTHLLGPTGTGKSTVLLSLALADVEAHRAVLLLDPKGDLATDLLARVPEGCHEDVVVIDPTNPALVGLNPLAGPARLAPVTADSLLGTLAALFREHWGVRTADVLNAALLTLARTPGANLLWLPPLLTDPAFRRRVLDGQDDPLGTGAFWAAYEAKRPQAQAVEIAPVLNKLRQLILRPHLRAVLGSLLVGQLWSRLLARQALPPERRHVVSVYIDEAHDFINGLPGDLSEALAQARSLGGALHLAHQYRAQLSPSMVQALETNARNKIYFGLSGTDAAAAVHLAPGLEAQDFIGLPAYHAYATLMQQGRSTGWLSVTTRPAPPARQEPASLYAASHQRYGVPAARTEQQLLALTSRTQQTNHHPHPPPNQPDEPDQPDPIGRRRR